MFSKTCREETAKLPPAFIEERRYLKNVTAKTLAWYEQSFRAFDRALADEATIKPSGLSKSDPFLLVLEYPHEEQDFPWAGTMPAISSTRQRAV
jgi:hypothetical protein